MTEMEKLEEAINTAKTGADMRKPLVDAFTYVFEVGRDVGTVGSHQASYFAKQSDMNTLIPFDNWSHIPPINKSNLVTNGTIFTVIHNTGSSANDLYNYVLNTIFS